MKCPICGHEVLDITKHVLEKHQTPVKVTETPVKITEIQTYKEMGKAMKEKGYVKTGEAIIKLAELMERTPKPDFAELLRSLAGLWALASEGDFGGAGKSLELVRHYLIQHGYHEVAPVWERTNIIMQGIIDRDKRKVSRAADEMFLFISHPPTIPPLD